MRIRGTPEDWLAWLVGPDPRKRKEAKLILGGLTPDDEAALVPLAKALASNDDVIVFWSVVALTRLGRRATSAVPALCRLANFHAQFGMRQAAVAALGQIAPGDGAAKAAVLNAISDLSPFVRREALQAICAFDSLSNVELGRIRAAASDPDETVARWSKAALRNIRARAEDPTAPPSEPDPSGGR
jgi:HEAT repeat protein